MKRITDSTFRYVPAAATDIKRTFERIRREQRAKAAQEAKDAAEAQAKTIKLKARSA